MGRSTSKKHILIFQKLKGHFTPFFKSRDTSKYKITCRTIKVTGVVLVLSCFLGRLWFLLYYQFGKPFTVHLDCMFT
jgi:hypothetical protein